MAINYELLNKGGISLGTNFELLSEKPLDSRLVVPSLDGLQNYIENAAAYEGMIVYVTSEKKHYEVKIIDGVLSYKQFGLTTEELNELITNATTAAMEFKGATNVLPENPAKGDMYKVAGENISITIGGVEAKSGDSIVYNGEEWFLIPSGDDIEDTWRPVTGVNSDASLSFVDGAKTKAIVAADGTIKYDHETIAAPELLAENEQTRTYITEVVTDGYGHVTGYKTATENVEDTNTTYEFECAAEHSDVYFTVKEKNGEEVVTHTVCVDAYSKNEADGKFVAKETGKSLVSDDEIARLAEVDNYDDEEVRDLIDDNAQAIAALDEKVGDIPTADQYKDLSVIEYINKKAEETLAAAQGGSSETAASVKQQLDNYKSENDTRVGKVEDDIAGLEDDIQLIAEDYLKGADKTELDNKITAETQRATLAETNIYTAIGSAKDQAIAAVQGTTTKTVKDIEDAAAANAKAISDHETLAAETYETKEDALLKKMAIDLSLNALETKVDVDSVSGAIVDEVKEETNRAIEAEKVLSGRIDVLEAIDHDAYIAADSALKTELEGKIEAAKTDAANQGAVILAESQKYTDDAITTVEGKVTELTGNVYAKEETFTKDEVNAAIEAALTAANSWGEF